VLERIDIFPWYRSESCYTKILEDPIHCWTFICLMASIVPHHTCAIGTFPTDVNLAPHSRSPDPRALLQTSFPSAADLV
jgi:hypothetical protein